MRKERIMKLPDGMVFMYYPDRKGIKINIEYVELIKCKHCKHCVEGITFGIHWLRCEQNRDAMKDVNENDWCCWAEREEE